MQNCTFKVLRLAVWVWMKIKQQCDCFRPEKGYIVVTEYLENPGLILEQVIRTRENGTRVSKYRIHWYNHHRNEITYEELFQHVMPPWLMISKDGEDFTEELHPYIAKGNIIRIHFLNWRFGEGKWKILDTKTFDEVDFPSQGIIIK